MNHLALKFALCRIFIDIPIGSDAKNLVPIRVEYPDNIAWNAIVIIIIRTVQAVTIVVNLKTIAEIYRLAIESTDSAIAFAVQFRRIFAVPKYAVLIDVT